MRGGPDGTQNSGEFPDRASAVRVSINNFRRTGVSAPQGGTSERGGEEDRRDDADEDGHHHHGIDARAVGRLIQHDKTRSGTPPIARRRMAFPSASPGVAKMWRPEMAKARRD